ncbi:MAG: MFS transporter [Candidatus Caldarchaeum sp.]
MGRFFTDSAGFMRRVFLLDGFKLDACMDGTYIEVLTWVLTTMSRTAKLFMSHMANDMLYSALPPLLPVLAMHHNLSIAALGLIPAVYMITASFLQVATGYIYDRRQVYAFMPAGLLIGGFAVAAVGFVEDYLLIYVLALLGGVGSALYHPVATSASSVSGKRSLSVSLFMTGGDLGLALGSLVCSLAVAAIGLRGTSLLLVLPVLTALLLTRVQFQHQAVRRQELGAAVRAVGLRYIYILVAAAMLRGVTVMSMITYLPLYLASQGYALAQAGGGLTLMLLAGAVGMVSAGVMASRMGKRRVVMMLLLSSTLFAYLTAITPPQYVLVPVSLFGLVALAAHPLLVAISHDMLPNNLGFASALIYGFTFGMVNVVVPMIGLAMDVYGYAPVFTVVSFLPLVSAALVSRLPASKVSLSTAN